mmetsp:Transcript_52978/g.79137  ORF Transcript_52978/g.79137 Transcript_52978/m.79137 type:complete len:94 (+) Transcript_52978:1857-2138(+)
MSASLKIVWSDNSSKPEYLSAKLVEILLLLLSQSVRSHADQRKSAPTVLGLCGPEKERTLCEADQRVHELPHLHGSVGLVYTVIGLSVGTVIP